MSQTAGSLMAQFLRSPKASQPTNTRIGRRVSSDHDRSGYQGLRLGGDPPEMV